MRIVTTIKAFMFFLITTLMVIFFIKNRGPVHVLFPFGKSIYFGTVYLLLIAYFLGVLTTVLAVVIIMKKLKEKRRLKESEDLIEEE